MFLKNKKNTRSSFNFFTVLALATMMFWCANTNTVNAQVIRGTLFDFTGNGKTDFATISGAGTGTNFTWKVAQNPQTPPPEFIRRFNFGIQGQDDVVPADYTGDGKTEPTVWRAASATYYVLQFQNGPGPFMLDRTFQAGLSTDDPSSMGDYDGDGKKDFTLVRQVSGKYVFYYLASGTNTFKGVTFGTITGTAAAPNSRTFPGADFNGDGRDELVVINNTAGGTRDNYFIGDSITGAGVITKTFGNFTTDEALPPGDYTGDGKADFVAVRAFDTGDIIWYINDSVTNATTGTVFGIGDPNQTNADFPLRGDYDGDGRQDIAVYRPSNQTFYWKRSSNGGLDAQQAGDPADTPIAAIEGY